MKKLFKPNKQKVTPTPFTIPSETPIHSQQTQYHQQRPSLDVPDDKWIVVNEESVSTPRTHSFQPPYNASLPTTISPDYPRAVHSPEPPVTQFAPPNPKRSSAINISAWPDPRTLDQPDTSSDTAAAPSVHSDAGKEPKDKEKDTSRLGNFFFGGRDKDKDKARERAHEKETEKERMLQEKQREKEAKEREANELTRMIGFLTATQCENLALVATVCERASANESSAKEAARALRREFKHAEPPSQISASRLWAIMLCNTSGLFIQQTASRKFLDTVEDVVTNSRTHSQVVSDLLNSLGIAVFRFAQDDKKHPFAVLWRKVRQPTQSEKGINPSNTLFDPPQAEITPPPPSIAMRPPSSPAKTHELVPPEPVTTGIDPGRKKRRERPSDREIILEQEINRIFADCELAKGNATLLNEALVYATPEDTESETSLIREFYLKCVGSQDRLVAQVPWATSLAESSRKEERELSPSHAPDSKYISEKSGVTIEEELLATLLSANQALFEALRTFDDLKRMAEAEREERAVKERSRLETRLDRSQYYVSADGSLAPPEQETGGSGPSRSPSPSPSPRAPPALLNHMSSPSTIPYSLQSHQSSGSLELITPHAPYHSAASQRGGSNHSLAPPPPPPQGPRQPLGATHVRTPSDTLSLSNTPGIITYTTPPTGLGLHGSGYPASSYYPQSASMDSVRSGLEQLDLRDANGSGVVPQTQPQPSFPPRSSSYASRDDEANHDVDRPIRPSAKALGKRRAVEPSEDTFDPDDMFKSPPDIQVGGNTRSGTPLSLYGVSNGHNSDDDSSYYDDRPHLPVKPVVYAYDAAAEREKERQMAIGRAATAAAAAATHRHSKQDSRTQLSQTSQ